MSQAFVIMQIGNPDLDKIYKDTIYPALKDGCGLEPKRVDKHNEGRLLKSEIVSFIETSDIIIADLTNERPNCYLEIGYAMGLDKFRNLILTCRDDHHQDNPNYIKGGPKVHFDLSGYDILFWSPDDLDSFKMGLINKVKRRLTTLIASSSPASVAKKWDDDWIINKQEAALKGLKETGLNGFMEIKMTLQNTSINATQTELLEVANNAQIHTFGWPIGVVIHNQNDRPRPTTDGIVAEVKIEDRSSYDYWAIKKDGAFYLLKSLFEERNKPGHLFFNVRITRITETLLYAVRLYSGLKAPIDSNIIIGIRHGGLRDRVLAASGNRSAYFDPTTSKEEEVYTEVETRIDKIETDLVGLVQQIIHPLFIVFDFKEISSSVVEDIVNKFVAGQCS